MLDEALRGCYASQAQLLSSIRLDAGSEQVSAAQAVADAVLAILDADVLRCPLCPSILML